MNRRDLEIISQKLEEMARLFDSVDIESLARLSNSVDTESLARLSNSVDTESLARLSNSYEVSSQYIEKLSSQITSLIDNINLDAIFEQYDQIYKQLDNIYHVDQQKIIDTLNKYQWFVLPEMPIVFIYRIIQLSEMDRPRERINKLFFDYFAYNNFENLKNLVEKWGSSGKFRPGRIKIIKDCLNAIHNAENGKIPSTILVPALIAQIDGIQREFLIKNNFKPEWTKFKLYGKGKKMNQTEAWQYIYSPEDEFSSIINDHILDVLFATALPGKPLKTPITFSRHKIMHGEHLNYGTKPNTIRTFLILDFLHDLF